ncbi:Endoglycoceramidase [Lamellibrachia satsuma]|nr:Endoglycoceramidase [Lamellibrachia satsuma]
MTMLITLVVLVTMLVLPRAVSPCCRPIPKPSRVGRIVVDGSDFVDKYGRTRFFHGFNAVNKGFPWYPGELLNHTKLRLYRSWGFNVVRLGTMWAGVEPERGRLNYTYISQLKETVEALANVGIFVILDMHQDVLSSYFGSYDGVPRWVIDLLPPPKHPYPWPLDHVGEKNWTVGYLTQAVGEAFQAIYDNVAGARNHMANFWTIVAVVFRGDTNVLGYEFINEPWAGDIYTDPTFLLPGIAGSRNLQPLYNVLNAAIRRIDTETLVFYEPVTWGVVLNGSRMGSGFSAVPGGPDFRNRSVFSYHYYCWILDVDRQHQVYDLFDRTVCDKLLGPLVFDTAKANIERLGGAAFMTEFGLCDPDGRRNSTATVECEFVISLAESNAQSWTYWDATFFDDEGNIRQSVVATFARVYVQAVAGKLLHSVFNSTTFVFHMRYIHDTTINEPTEIAVPRMHYPRGFLVRVSWPMQWSFDETLSVLYVTTCWYPFKNLFEVEVEVRPLGFV